MLTAEHVLRRAVHPSVCLPVCVSACLYLCVSVCVCVWWPVACRRDYLRERERRLSPVSIQTQSLALRALRKNENRKKPQPIGMLSHSSGNHDWLLANAIACVYCGFHLRNARNASDCVWMETALYTHTHTRRLYRRCTTNSDRSIRGMCFHCSLPTGHPGAVRSTA